MEEAQKGELVHIAGISSYSLSDFMVLDETSRRNLELFETVWSRSKRGSLLGVMDQTVTAMGARMLEVVVALSPFRRGANTKAG